MAQIIAIERYHPDISSIRVYGYRRNPIPENFLRKLRQICSLRKRERHPGV